MASFVKDLTMGLEAEAHHEEDVADFSINEFSRHYSVDISVTEAIVDLCQELSD